MKKQNLSILIIFLTFFAQAGEVKTFTSNRIKKVTCSKALVLSLETQKINASNQVKEFDKAKLWRAKKIQEKKFTSPEFQKLTTKLFGEILDHTDIGRAIYFNRELSEKINSAEIEIHLGRAVRLMNNMITLAKDDFFWHRMNSVQREEYQEIDAQFAMNLKRHDFVLTKHLKINDPLGKKFIEVLDEYNKVLHERYYEEETGY